MGDRQADCFHEPLSEASLEIEVHEWAIMEDFSNSVPSDWIRDELLRAIHGRGHSEASRMPSGGTGSNQPGLNFARRRCGRSRSTGAKKITLLGSRSVVS
jgi:hypothetical protein